MEIYLFLCTTKNINIQYIGENLQYTISSENNQQYEITFSKTMLTKNLRIVFIT